MDTLIQDLRYIARKSRRAETLCPQDGVEMLARSAFALQDRNGHGF